MEKSGVREYEPLFPEPKLGVKGSPNLGPVEPLLWIGKGPNLFGPSFSKIGDTSTIHHPGNKDFSTDSPLGLFIPNVNRFQFTFKDLKLDSAKSGISSSFPEKPINANKKTDPFFSIFSTGLPPGFEEIQTTNKDLGSHKSDTVQSSPKWPKHVDRSAAAAANKETSFERFQTADNDLESDKRENFESYPKKPKHVGSFAAAAAANKTAGGVGEDSYDKSSNQATHVDSDPYNRSILVDNNLAANNITDEHLRNLLAPFGEIAFALIMEETQCGFAMFFTRRSAEEAVRNLNGTDFAGQKLRLSFASDKVIREAMDAKFIFSGWSTADPAVSDRGPPPSPWSGFKTIETGDMRIQTTVKDLELDKSENVDRYTKTTGGNGQGSYDGSSSPATQSDTGPKAASYKSIQASHGDMDPKIPNNTSILVDNRSPMLPKSS